MKASRTPLHEASENGHMQVVKVLFEFGADLSVEDEVREPQQS
jgi:ankyrin repeat protein